MTKKESALNFLRLAAKGESHKAFQLYAGENFKHHNIYFKGDANTIITAMEDNAEKNPQLTMEVQRTLEDGNLVAVHSRVRQNPADLGAALIHILRFDNDKIVEVWDLAQAVPAETVNENGMF